MKYVLLLLLTQFAFATPLIPDQSITSAKIKDANVTTVKILDGNVTTPKIPDGAITQAKRVALGQQISSSTTFSTSSSTMVDVTNLTVTITTTGRPVFIGLINDQSNTGTSFISSTSASNIKNVTIAIVKDGSELIRQPYEIQASAATISSISYPVSSFSHIDVPTAGSHTYKIQMLSSNSDTVQIVRAKLIAYEL